MFVASLEASSHLRLTILGLLGLVAVLVAVILQNMHLTWEGRPTLLSQRTTEWAVLAAWASASMLLLAAKAAITLKVTRLPQLLFRPASEYS